MLSRRETILGGALALIFAQSQGSCAALRARNSFGCLLADEDVPSVYPQSTDTRLFATGNEPMIPKSGDKYFDIALAQTLAKISSFFGILPAFAYYDDYDGLNAYATPVRRLNRVDGTVLMGTGFLRFLRSKTESPEVAVAGVCAHEFGHILQFRHGLDTRLKEGQPSVKRAELQADYFAGYFAGLRKRERPTFPSAVVALTLYEIGDTAFSAPDHHGTPRERGEAVSQGFEASFRQNKTLSQAVEESTSFVLSL
jgi:hypothetical protein